MYDTVKQAGISVVGIDVDENLCLDVNDLEKKIKKNKIKVIINVYSYGNIPNNKKIYMIAKKYGCYVIDDMAQCYSAIENGKICGLDSYGSIISLDVTKYITSFGGGILLVNNKSAYYQIKKQIAENKVKSKNLFKDLFGDIHKISQMIAFKFATIPLVYTLFVRQFIPYLRSKSFYRPKIKELSSVGKSIVFTQIKKINDIIKYRKMNAEYIQKLISVKYKIHSNDSSMYLFLPISLKNTYNINTNNIRSDGRLFTKLCGKLTNIVDLPEPAEFLAELKIKDGKDGEFPNAENMQKNLILIPTYKNILRARKKIIQVLLNA